MPRFGVGGDWYPAFAQAERDTDYPVDAFSRQVELPAPHLDLLVSLLDVTFSIAARAEANGISGSKFSKLIGLWLLEDKGERDAVDWSAFYIAWEQAGRMLEHLFLARVR